MTSPPPSKTTSMEDTNVRCGPVHHHSQKDEVSICRWRSGGVVPVLSRSTTRAARESASWSARGSVSWPVRESVSWSVREVGELVGAGVGELVGEGVGELVGEGAVMLVGAAGRDLVGANSANWSVRDLALRIVISESGCPWVKCGTEASIPMKLPPFPARHCKTKCCRIGSRLVRFPCCIYNPILIHCRTKLVGEGVGELVGEGAVMLIGAAGRALVDAKSASWSARSSAS